MSFLQYYLRAYFSMTVLIHPDICYELLAHVFMYSKRLPNPCKKYNAYPRCAKDQLRCLQEKSTMQFPLALQLVNPHLNVLEHTQENHIVDSCTNKNDR